MDHLTYQETNNKAFKPYYDKFKKMVKEDLTGDGWFLLVKNFPFKDGDDLMFTAGENIGKWQDKNLVSLYGKTNYIIGRCRKRGPVLTLLDFQEGDYVKQATESGLRKELKEYFKGTGVSVRVFKSLKVNEPEPEQEEDDETEMSSEVPASPLSGEVQDIRNMESPTQKRSAIMALINKVLADAQKAGITDQGAYNVHLNNLKRHVSGGKVDAALGEIEAIIQLIEAASPTEEESGKEPALDLSAEKERIQKLSDELRKKALGKLEELLQLVEDEAEELEEESQDSYQQQIGLVEETEKILEEILQDHLTRLQEIEELGV